MEKVRIWIQIYKTGEKLMKMGEANLIGRADWWKSVSDYNI